MSFAFALLLASAISIELHIAPGGSDRNPGTRERPLATLEGARDALRRLRAGAELPPGGATIWLAPGSYPRQRTFELSKEDSGRAGAEVVYRAREEGRAVLDGGIALDPAAFEVVSERAILERLGDRKARAALRAIDLAAAGIEELAPITARGFGQPIRPAPAELYWNDRPLVLARWPNEGFARVGAVLTEGAHPGFHYRGDRPRRWRGAPDAWLYGYWFFDWADEAIPLAAIDEPAGTLRLATAHRYGLKAGSPFYAENILEEIDRPGEYYIDRRRRRLYLWPPGPLVGARIELSHCAGPLIAIEQGAHIVLRGLDLRLARGDAIRIHGGEGVTVAACTLRQLGNRAVVISGGREHAVAACEIRRCGEGALVLAGGERTTLTPAGHRAHNNHIHHYSRRSRTYRPAIQLTGVGCRATNNLIHDAPHAAILFNGNDHLIEANEIHHVLTSTGDGGAVYTGRDWSARGHIIRRNYFHDIAGLGKWENAVYLDDQASGIEVRENIFERCHWGMLVGGGRDNLIAGNLFLDCRLAIHLDARGLGWAARTRATLEKRLRALPYRRGIWARRYPRLVPILDEQPMEPRGNILRDNLLVRSGRIDQDLAEAARRLATIENNRALAALPAGAGPSRRGIGPVLDGLRRALPRRR